MAKNYGTIPKTVELRFTKEILKKTMKLIYYRKTMAICQTIEIFEKICSLRTLIYFGKTMILLGEKNYDTVPETMEL